MKTDATLRTRKAQVQYARVSYIAPQTAARKLLPKDADGSSRRQKNLFVAPKVAPKVLLENGVSSGAKNKLTLKSLKATKPAPSRVLSSSKLSRETLQKGYQDKRKALKNKRSDKFIQNNQSISDTQNISTAELKNIRARVRAIQEAQARQAAVEAQAAASVAVTVTQSAPTPADQPQPSDAPREGAPVDQQPSGGTPQPTQLAQPGQPTALATAPTTPTPTHPASVQAPTKPQPAPLQPLPQFMTPAPNALSGVRAAISGAAAFLGVMLSGSKKLQQEIPQELQPHFTTKKVNLAALREQKKLEAKGIPAAGQNQLAPQTVAPQNFQMVQQPQLVPGLPQPQLTTAQQPIQSVTPAMPVSPHPVQPQSTQFQQAGSLQQPHQQQPFQNPAQPFGSQQPGQAQQPGQSQPQQRQPTGLTGVIKPVNMPQIQMPQGVPVPKVTQNLVRQAATRAPRQAQLSSSLAANPALRGQNRPQNMPGANSNQRGGQPTSGLGQMNLSATGTLSPILPSQRTGLTGVIPAVNPGRGRPVVPTSLGIAGIGRVTVSGSGKIGVKPLNPAKPIPAPKPSVKKLKLKDVPNQATETIETALKAEKVALEKKATEGLKKAQDDALNKGMTASNTEGADKPNNDGSKLAPSQTPVPRPNASKSKTPDRRSSEEIAKDELMNKIFTKSGDEGSGGDTQGEESKVGSLETGEVPSLSTLFGLKKKFGIDENQDGGENREGEDNKETSKHVPRPTLTEKQLHAQQQVTDRIQKQKRVSGELPQTSGSAQSSATPPVIPPVREGATKPMSRSGSPETPAEIEARRKAKEKAARKALKAERKRKEREELERLVAEQRELLRQQIELQSGARNGMVPNMMPNMVGVNPQFGAMPNMPMAGNMPASQLPISSTAQPQMQLPQPAQASQPSQQMQPQPHQPGPPLNPVQQLEQMFTSRPKPAEQPKQPELQKPQPTPEQLIASGYIVPKKPPVPISAPVVQVSPVAISAAPSPQPQPQPAQPTAQPQPQTVAAQPSAQSQRATQPQQQVQPAQPQPAPAQPTAQPQPAAQSQTQPQPQPQPAQSMTQQPAQPQQPAGQPQPVQSAQPTAEPQPPVQPQPQQPAGQPAQTVTQSQPQPQSQQPASPFIRPRPEKKPAKPRATASIYEKLGIRPSYKDNPNYISSGFDSSLDHLLKDPALKPAASIVTEKPKKIDNYLPSLNPNERAEKARAIMPTDSFNPSLELNKLMIDVEAESKIAERTIDSRGQVAIESIDEKLKDRQDIKEFPKY